MPIDVAVVDFVIREDLFRLPYSVVAIVHNKLDAVKDWTCSVEVTCARARHIFKKPWTATLRKRTTMEKVVAHNKRSMK